MPEIVRSIRPGRRAVAVLDFDGTLSLIRSGWVDIMVNLMVSVLRPLPGTAESEPELAAFVTDFVLNLNGRPTIFQMDRLVAEARRRGGRPESADRYTRQFLDALHEKSARRIRDLEAGVLTEDDLLVPGARMLLTDLASRGLELTLASGTAVHHVRNEAALLGIDHYFAGRIFGPGEDPRTFSKLAVMQQALAGRPGTMLLGFGDGFVEIENVKQLGGIAVGCATDEQHRSGKVEAWKRTRLIRAGADAIIADYSNWPVLARQIFSP